MSKLKIGLLMIAVTIWVILVKISFELFLKEHEAFYLISLLVLLAIAGLIIFLEWKKYKKEEAERKRKQEKENKKNRRTSVKFEHSYFGKGSLIKETRSETKFDPEDLKVVNGTFKIPQGPHETELVTRFVGLESGFEKIFESFGKHNDAYCDMGELDVREENIEHVFDSLQKVYERFEQIMEGCYDEMYELITREVEEGWGERLKPEFDLEYLKENWKVYCIDIYDGSAVYYIKVDAAEDPKTDHTYSVSIVVDYSTLTGRVDIDHTG